MVSRKTTSGVDRSHRRGEGGGEGGKLIEWIDADSRQRAERISSGSVMESTT